MQDLIVTSTWKPDLGAELAIIREESGLSQSQLAKRMNVSRSTLARIERCQTADMRVWHIYNYLRACGMKMKITFVE